MKSSLRRCLLLSCIATADPAGAEWTAPAAPPESGAPPATAEGEFSRPDRTEFDEKHREGLADRVCSKLTLKHTIKIRGPHSAVLLNPRRELAAYPDRSLAVVDAARVSGSLGHALSSPVGQGASLFVSAGVSLSGMSETVRPLRSERSCEQLPRLLTPGDFKFAFPFTAERVSAMEVGELWNLPFTLTVSRAVGASLSTPEGSIGVSMGLSDDGRASLTLYRLAENQVRLKFRADYVRIRSKSAAAAVTVPPLQFASNIEHFLAELAERQVNRELVRYFSLLLSASTFDGRGQQLVLEFVADPRDAAQAEAVAEALSGNFIELAALGAKLGALQVSEADIEEFYRRRRTENAKALGSASHAAIERHASRGFSWSMNALALARLAASESRCDREVTQLDGGEGRIAVHCGEETWTDEFLRVPFLGALSKGSAQRRMDAVNLAAPGRPFDETRMVYLENRAFVRVPASYVDAVIGSINDTLSLAGAQRGAAPGRLRLNARDVIPPPSGGRGREDSDHRGQISLNLTFNQKAVREASFAAAERILAAFQATLGAADRPLFDWLMKAGRLEDGRFSYDHRALMKEFEGRAAPERSLDLAARWLGRDASRLLADFAALREARSEELRARRLRDMMTGESESGLGLEPMLKIVIQLVDPEDITGDFLAAVRGRAAPGGPKFDNRVALVLKEGRAEVPGLKGAAEIRARFARPSRLQD